MKAVLKNAVVQNWARFAFSGGVTALMIFLFVFFGGVKELEAGSINTQTLAVAAMVALRATIKIVAELIVGALAPHVLPKIK